MSLQEQQRDEELTGRGRTARWVLVTTSAQFLKVVLTIASAAILGRILTPVDFGLIASAAPVLAFATMFQNLGLSQALVQHPDLSKAHISALFYITLCVSVALAIPMYLVAPAIAGVLNEPRLVGVIRALSVVTILSGVASTPLGLLNRQLKFVHLAAIEVASSLGSLAVGVVVALVTSSYWALVIMQGCNVLFLAVGSLLFCGWSPRAAQFDETVRSMLGFGAGFSSFNILNFLSRNADNMLIARTYGAEAVGLYDRAYKLMLAPLNQAIQPFGRVLTPVLAKLQQQPESYLQRYMETTTALMAAVQPTLMVTVIFSLPTVRLVLGEAWTASAPIFFWLAITGLHQVFTSTFGWLFVSQNRGSDFAILGLFGAVVAVGSFVLGLPDGPVGVARAYAIGDLLLRVPFTWWLAGRRGPIGTTPLLATFTPHALAMLVCASALACLANAWTRVGPWQLLVAVVASYAVYLPVLGLFKAKRRLALDGLRSILRRVGPQTS